MNAMSPFRMFINCGSSSILVERIKRPTLVSRAASGSKFPSLSHSSVIVLNFNALNIFSFLPGRGCMKKTPFHPFLLTWKRRIIVTINMGNVNTNATRAPRKLIGLFMKVI